MEQDLIKVRINIMRKVNEKMQERFSRTLRFWIYERVDKIIEEELNELIRTLPNRRE